MGVRKRLDKMASNEAKSIFKSVFGISGRRTCLSSYELNSANLSSLQAYCLASVGLRYLATRALPKVQIS